MMSLSMLFLLIMSSIGIAMCSALMNIPSTQLIHSSISPRSYKLHITLFAENRDDDEGSVTGSLDSLISSFPSPNNVKENILEGEVGERGEQYVVAQFGVLLFIAIGGIPFVGDGVISALGLLMILGGVILVYKSASDLSNNLSPWPMPSSKGYLINGGIYKSIRHPMYAGLLLGMTGLSLMTDSIARLLLTMILYFVLDAKSDYEEEKLREAYPEYEDYALIVQGKFLPQDVKKVHNK